ncbi:Pilin accessory protein (PilO) [Pseudomonas asturiensis]|uniref:Pilin accessory protein (PilO) n=1 Tax=Pseudomonas asturiensis TaxID=1190415 RepID=A0A1M7P7G4_9PSED|nr:type 4b pilus protein PilO2 [Pseudomonas asturiensis]SHN12609.1 Pilin accessory protein (PilO) [Pseudomonas asturiensis]
MANASTSADKSVQILSYHGKTFVTGLFWHPLGSLNGYMREARQFGRQEKMDIVAIRHTQSIIQAGFVARSAGAVKGMYSLAATLAGQLGSSWFAAWRLTTDEDRYALVAVYEGAVIPGYDLVGTADEIQRKVRQLLSRSINFEKSYLPAEFDKDAVPLDIDVLLSPANLRREYQLRPLAFGLSTHELMRLAALCAVLVCLTLSWQQWKAYKNRLILEANIAAEKQRQAELEELSQRTNQTQTIQALEHPWAKRPTAIDFIEGCNSSIDWLPPSIAGWIFISAECNGELISASFMRTGNSTTDGFLEATRGYLIDSPLFSADRNNASIRLGLHLKLAGDEELSSAEEAFSRLTSWLHAQSLAPTFKEVVDVLPQPAPLPGQSTIVPPLVPDWKHFEFSYDSSLPPAVALRGVPDTGLRVREIKTSMRNKKLTWTVTGDLYAK